MKKHVHRGKHGAPTAKVTGIRSIIISPTYLPCNFRKNETFFNRTTFKLQAECNSDHAYNLNFLVILSPSGIISSNYVPTLILPQKCTLYMVNMQ